MSLARPPEVEQAKRGYMGFAQLVVKRLHFVDTHPTPHTNTRLLIIFGLVLSTILLNSTRKAPCDAAGHGLAEDLLTSVLTRQDVGDFSQRALTLH